MGLFRVVSGFKPPNEFCTVKNLNWKNMTKFTADSRDTTPGIFFWLRPCIDVTVLITSTSPSKALSFPFLFPSIPPSLSLSCFLSFLLSLSSHFFPSISISHFFSTYSPPILLHLPSCSHLAVLSSFPSTSNYPVHPSYLLFRCSRHVRYTLPLPYTTSTPYPPFFLILPFHSLHPQDPRHPSSLNLSLTYQAHLSHYPSIFQLPLVLYVDPSPPPQPPTSFPFIRILTSSFRSLANVSFNSSPPQLLIRVTVLPSQTLSTSTPIISSSFSNLHLNVLRPSSFSLFPFPIPVPLPSPPIQLHPLTLPSHAVSTLYSPSFHPCPPFPLSHHCSTIHLFIPQPSPIPRPPIPIHLYFSASRFFLTSPTQRPLLHPC